MKPLLIALTLLLAIPAIAKPYTIATETSAMDIASDGKRFSVVCVPRANGVSQIDSGENCLISIKEARQVLVELQEIYRDLKRMKSRNFICEWKLQKDLLLIVTREPKGDVAHTEFAYLYVQSHVNGRLQSELAIEVELPALFVGWQQALSN